MRSLAPRHGRLRTVVSAVGLAALVVATAGCGGSSSSATGADSFTVAVQSAFVNDLTPGASASSYVDYALWTPLTQVDPSTGELVNAVAESLESTDQKTWTITLKDGWTFHDGSPVTAQSFADSWNVTADPANALIGNFSMSIIEGYAEMNPVEGEPTAKTLSGVEVVDELTLEVTLNAPNALLPYIVSSTTFAPMPESGLKNLKSFGTSVVGNGPYQLADKSFKPSDQDIQLDAYDDYAGTPAVTPNVDLRLYQDPSTVYTDFQAGTVDLALLDGSDLADAQSEFAEQVVDVQFPAVVFLGFPLYDQRFADPAVREAISLAIDRETIVNTLLEGLATPAEGLAPDTLVGGGAADCPACTYDPERARELFDSAGGWEGPMTLYTSQDPTNEKVVEAIANQLRTNLGIEEVQFKALDLGQLYETFTAQTSDGPALAYSGATYPHVYTMADQMFSAGGFLNTTGYESSGFADTMAGAATASDVEETTALAQDAVQTALADLPVAPLYWPQGGIVHAENLSGVEPEFLGGPHLASVEAG